MGERMAGLEDSALERARRGGRGRRSLSTLSDKDRLRYARRDPRQLSIFGPQHTRELAAPLAIKRAARRGYNGDVL